MDVLRFFYPRMDTCCDTLLFEVYSAPHPEMLAVG